MALKQPHIFVMNKKKVKNQWEKRTLGNTANKALKKKKKKKREEGAYLKLVLGGRENHMQNQPWLISLYYTEKNM